MVNIAVDDLGSSAAKKYDCEAWLPGQERFRELTSTSNTTDFQARRLEIRMRPAGGGSPRVLHTLNGTAVAVGRTIIALLENGQQDDGSVVIPEVLHAWGAPAAGTGTRMSEPKNPEELDDRGADPRGGRPADGRPGRRGARSARTARVSRIPTAKSRRPAAI